MNTSIVTNSNNQELPTIKMNAVSPNKYANVLMSKGMNYYEGDIITYLSLDEWANVYCYKIWNSGISLKASSGEYTYISKIEL